MHIKKEQQLRSLMRQMDWTAPMSDDMGVYQRGQAQLRQIDSLASELGTRGMKIFREERKQTNDASAH